MPAIVRSLAFKAGSTTRNVETLRARSTRRPPLKASAGVPPASPRRSPRTSAASNALTIPRLQLGCAGIGSAVAVQTANLVAAGIVAKGWQAALISTGWGAFAVAAGIAAAYIVTRWTEVQNWFSGFWIWMQEQANNTVYAIADLFSHIPRHFGGGWAQDLKEKLDTDLNELESQAGANAQKAGRGIADEFNTGLTTATPPRRRDATRHHHHRRHRGRRRTNAPRNRTSGGDAMIGRMQDRVVDVKSLIGQLALVRQDRRS
jgi:hypothetical protein